MSEPQKCPELTHYPTPFICDFWVFEDDYLEAGQTVIAWVDRPDGRLICGRMTVVEGGTFLLHVYGDDGDGTGAQDLDEVYFGYEHPLYGCVKMRVKGDTLWRDKESKQLSLVQPGDFDEDGRLTAMDFGRCVAAAFQGSGENCDVNGDGVTNVRDAALLSSVIFRGGDKRKLVWGW